MGNNIQDCFNRRCRFNLKTGESLIGGVIDILDGKVTIETNNKEKKSFSENNVESYNILDNRRIDNSNQVRSNLIGQHAFTFRGVNKISKLVILGAGASHDFQPEMDEGTRPPLSNQLFGDNSIINEFKGALLLKPKILTAIYAGETLEDFFQEQWDEAYKRGNNELIARLINSQFYIQHVFKTFSYNLRDEYPNNYTALVHNLMKIPKRDPREKILVVTFNYDTLFENALHHICDWRMSTIEEYIHQDIDPETGSNLKPIMLFKPHGSWNWIHTTGRPFLRRVRTHDNNSLCDTASEYYEQKINFAQLKYAISPILKDSNILLQEIPSFVRDNFKIVDYDNPLNYEYYPNLLIPFKTKDEVLMPLLHQHALHHLLRDVTDILTIGWKGTEDKFNTLLKQSIGQKSINLLSVSRGEPTVQNELGKYLNIKNPIHYRGTFSRYISELKQHNPEYNFFK